MSNTFGYKGKNSLMGKPSNKPPLERGTKVVKNGEHPPIIYTVYGHDITIPGQKGHPSYIYALTFVDYDGVISYHPAPNRPRHEIPVFHTWALASEITVI